MPRTLTRLLALALLVPAAHGSTALAPTPAVASTLAHLPLLFVENRGQLDRRVAYVVQGSDRTLYFTPSGVTIVLHGAGRRAAMKLRFPGAREGVRPEGQDPTPATFNWWKGSRDEWRTGVRTYRRLVYRDLWPGIDLEYVVGGDRIEHNFIVRPGADPARIRLAYRGADRLDRAADGTLEVRAGAGGFRDQALYAYQDVGGERLRVAADFELGGSNTHEYGFRLGPYERRRPLVIDPASIIYAGYFSDFSGNNVATVAGTGSGNRVAVNDMSNAFIAGTTDGGPGTFPPTMGPSLMYHGNYDAFVAKVDAGGGGLVYAGYYGGSDAEGAAGIAVDTLGNAYIAGGTGSDDLPVVQNPPAGNPPFKLFVAKIVPDGSAVAWTILIPTFTSSLVNAIATDPANNVYLTGATSATDFPVQGGPDLSYNDVGNPLLNGDGWVMKLTSAGGLVYSGFIGGANCDIGTAVTADADGNAYVTGQTESDESSFPVLVGPDLSFNGGGGGCTGGDAFVAKIGPAGQLLYCGYIGGSGNDFANAIAVDSQGSAYVAGTSLTTDGSFPVVGGPSTTRPPSGDGFVTKVRADAMSLGYSGYLGNRQGGANAARITVDGAGAAYVAGSTSSTAADGTGFPGASIFGNIGSGATLVARINPGGSSLDWSAILGGTISEPGGIALDATGVYVTGTASQAPPAFPATGGPSLTFNGNTHGEVYVAKLTGTGGGGGAPICPTCRANLAAALPPPASARDRRSRRVANGLARLDASIEHTLDRAAALSGRRRTRRLRHARALLNRLLARARRADQRGTLGVPLPPIEDAVASLLAAIAT